MCPPWYTLLVSMNQRVVRKPSNERQTDRSAQISQKQDGRNIDVTVATHVFGLGTACTVTHCWEGCFHDYIYMTPTPILLL